MNIINVCLIVGFAILCVDGKKHKHKEDNPWEPHIKREAPWWKEKHEHFLNTTKSMGSSIKIVFIGSSSCEYWLTAGKSVWDEHYVPLGAVNYGIHADRTENVLWRIDHGELDGLNPKLFVIYVGGNNMKGNFTQDGIVRGVMAVIDKIHGLFPDANILYVGFFPRGYLKKDPEPGAIEIKRNITETLKSKIDGDTTRKSTFLDLYNNFVIENTDKIKEELYQEDKLHLNLDGYKLWNSLMKETVLKLIK